MRMNGSISNVLGSFLAGLGVGAAGALLYAPASGGETRQRIRDTASSGTQAVRDRANTLKQQATEVLDGGRRSLIARSKKSPTQSTPDGKRSPRHARQKPQRLLANTRPPGVTLPKETRKGS